MRRKKVKKKSKSVKELCTKVLETGRIKSYSYSIEAAKDVPDRCIFNRLSDGNEEK